MRIYRLDPIRSVRRVIFIGLVHGYSTWSHCVVKKKDVI